MELHALPLMYSCRVIQLKALSRKDIVTSDLEGFELKEKERRSHRFMISVLPGPDDCDCRSNRAVMAALAHATTMVVRIRAMMNMTGLSLAVAVMTPRRFLS